MYLKLLVIIILNFHPTRFWTLLKMGLMLLDHYGVINVS